MGWTEFAGAFATFFLTHALPLRPSLRPWLRARLGPRGFGLAYSALSLAALAWLIAAAGRAPHLPLWDWAPWQNHVVLAAMLPACVLVALAAGRPNPLSFGGAGNHRFDPSRPGIVRLTRHPLLAALAIWAGAHLVPNGDLAHAILFGAFAGFAALGGRLVDRRRRREMGADWARLRAAVVAGPWLPRPVSWPGAGLRLAAGIALYAALVLLHPVLIGADPLP